MNINLREFKISAVYEKDGKTQKKEFQYRVGKKGRIGCLKEGTSMYFMYSDGHGTLITSDVSEYQEDDRGVWVTTQNSVYVLDDVVDDFNYYK